VERVGERAIAFMAGDGLGFIGPFRAVMKLERIRMAP
jgi:hypothetical protein